MAWLQQIFSFLGPKDEIIIVPYKGYANEKKIYLKGRVLKNKRISIHPSNSKLRNLLNTYKRFETDEIGCIRINVTINDQHFELTTDSEGYFMIDGDWIAPSQKAPGEWLESHIEIDKKDFDLFGSAKDLGEIYYTKGNLDYGVISDIDDTVLQSHVTSRLKWKLFYVTLFKNASERKPIDGVVRLFQKLAKGADGQQNNPIFYVSHSPWNLYDLIDRFLNLQNLPKGPVLLRDYGLKPSGHFKDHKMESIRHILKMYPNLQFILIGDSGEQDADIYLKMASEFPSQIKAIYIRKIKKHKNANRIEELFQKHPGIIALLTESSEKMLIHARQNGFVPNT